MIKFWASPKTIDESATSSWSWLPSLPFRWSCWTSWFPGHVSWFLFLFFLPVLEWMARPLTLLEGLHVSPLLFDGLLCFRGTLSLLECTVCFSANFLSERSDPHTQLLQPFSPSPFHFWKKKHTFLYMVVDSICRFLRWLVMIVLNIVIISSTIEYLLHSTDGSMTCRATQLVWYLEKNIYKSCNYCYYPSIF